MDELKFDRDRSTFTDEIYGNEMNVDYIKTVVGFILFFIIFVVTIPHFLIKNELFYILTAYFPHLGTIGGVLGYKGGPLNIWKYLYNPVNSTITGFVTRTLIDFFSLLGLTFVVAYYTKKYKNINLGWSRAFFMIPLTYLLPGNIVVYLLNKIGGNRNLIKIISNYETGLIYLLGLSLVLGIIVIEALAISYFSPFVSTLIRNVSKIYEIEL